MKNIVLIIFLLLISPAPVSAQVVVNEFSSGSTNDWVELYYVSTATESASLAGYSIQDSGSYNNDLSGEIDPNGFVVFEVGNRLNKAGDIIKLVDPLGVVSEVSYGDKGGVCVAESGESIGRSTDGTGGFVKFASPTKSLANTSQESECVVATPEPTVESTPTPTPLPSVTAIATATPLAKRTARPSLVPKSTPRESDVLALRAQLRSSEPEASEEEEEIEEESGGVSLFAILLILVGVVFLGVGAYPFLKMRLQAYTEKRDSFEEGV